MDLMIASLFGFLGAGAVWLFYKRKVPLKDIVSKRSTINDMIGLLILIIVGSIIYYLKNKTI